MKLWFSPALSTGAVAVRGTFNAQSCVVLFSLLCFGFDSDFRGLYEKNWFKVAKCDELRTVFFVESIRMYGGLALKASCSELGTLV